MLFNKNQVLYSLRVLIFGYKYKNKESQIENANVFQYLPHRGELIIVCDSRLSSQKEVPLTHEIQTDQIIKSLVANPAQVRPAPSTVKIHFFPLEAVHPLKPLKQHSLHIQPYFQPFPISPTHIFTWKWLDSKPCF
jgi:hypothetical protein